jgi:hypothetical protein
MFFLNLSGHFYSDRYCLKSLTLYYREVSELPRCPKCQQLNPSYKDNDAEPIPSKKHLLSLSGPNSELIDLSSTPPGPNEANMAKGFSASPLPARRDRKA